MRKYFKIRNYQSFKDKGVRVQNRRTGEWEPMKPILLQPNLIEWFIHKILGKHFSYGQPFCVYCGYAAERNK